ncbi:DUF4389 domain-containing protein [Candidatus Pacearchaeota archaeon]|nr:DUF4389 domain-containing protein [Candidatus Pacearchaeota archaeon]
MVKYTERQEAIFKIIVLIVSGVILYVWMYLAAIIALINWIYTLINNKRSKDLAEFGEFWNTETYRYVRYISGVSNVRPFPFSPLQRISNFVNS